MFLIFFDIRDDTACCWRLRSVVCVCVYQLAHPQFLHLHNCSDSISVAVRMEVSLL